MNVHKLKSGSVLKYTGDDVTYGGYEDPSKTLTKNQQYILSEVKIKSSTTGLIFRGIFPEFNSVNFEVIQY